jgi:argininosuccinate lyase
MSSRITLFCAVFCCFTARGADSFGRLSQINKASIVMLVETGIVSKPIAAEIARGIRAVMAGEDKPGAQRSGDYLIFEAALLKVAGPNASRLHTGRSRQDIGSTSQRMARREALLATYEAALEPRRKLLELAAKHVETVIPAYTHGLQAQPISLAHYLLAFAAALDRDAERYESLWGRLNRSPLGAAALATSGFPLDRRRLAELLGFDGVVVNSFDANQVSPADTMVEFASVMGNAALQIGRFVQDIHIQYHDPVPWITLDPSLTHPSSIMPQKRNPGPLEALRINCTMVAGDAQTVWLLAHNASSGMNDSKEGSRVLRTSDEAREMYKTFGVVVGGLVVNPKRSLAEVDADYSTMTEVADTLLRHAGIPFRTGHHYASEITTFGREHGKRPKDLSDAELARIYEQAAGGEKLPLPPQRIREALNAEDVVRNRKGLGGTQPEEVNRMLAEHRRVLENNGVWLRARREALAQADAKLEQAFRDLADTASAPSKGARTR